MFEAILIEKTETGQSARLQKINEGTLPEGDVTVRVAWSTLNYKDALAITGKSPVVRKFPMIPGIDLAGVVEHSDSADWKPGDRVVLNGWGVGETHWGGLAERARLKSEWLVPLETAFTMSQAMAIGTAGYTAMLCVMALEKHEVLPGSGPVLVTGAAGGVGSVAVSLLSKLGYQVVAVTGRPQEERYLKGLGASEILPREEFSAPGRPLGKERWAGAVDVAGGQVLANVCASMQYGGTVAACGLAAGMSLPTTVAPFILRSVTLAGIDSVMCPQPRRREAWKRLGQDLDPAILADLCETRSLAECIPAADHLLAGHIRGRIIVPLEGGE